MNKEFENKKLLVLGGIKLECDIVLCAQKLGAYVVVLDYDVDSPAKKIADEAVLMDAKDEDAIAEYCIKNNIDGITTGFIDFLLPVCRHVCDRLGLPYYANEKIISMATNKIDFKETCLKYGLPVPKTYYEGNDIPEHLYSEINYPVFVKPLDASGSRGCCVCNNKNELKRNFSAAVSFSKTSTAIVEDYITGREFLLNYVISSGEYRVISMFDRYVCSDRGSAVNYSNISLAPAKALDYYMKNLNVKTINMFKDLGLTEGIIFIQGFYDNKKITFYEMGCRLGGSYYHLESVCTGYNPVEFVVRHALSGTACNNIDKIDENIAFYKKYAASCNFLLKGAEGIIDRIKGIDVMKKLPSYVNHLQLRYDGDHYSLEDKIFDKPVVCIYLANDSLEQLKLDLKTLNKEFDVYDKNGQSLLKEKYNPDLL